MPAPKPEPAPVTIAILCSSLILCVRVRRQTAPCRKRHRSAAPTVYPRRCPARTPPSARRSQRVAQRPRDAWRQFAGDELGKPALARLRRVQSVVCEHVGAWMVAHRDVQHARYSYERFTGDRIELAHAIADDPSQRPPQFWKIAERRQPEVRD